ncbi:hypothetical protein FRC18_001188 [Serendipita sp. 400]|nr:hypothetical protein FRC18_001188 [Serendipita sp. 400]
MNAEPDNIRVLSLDGGDVFCMSQLEILKEYMYRLEMDTSSTVRVCDHFDLIVGVGGGGILAILLGVMGLTVDEATDVYIRICNSVFLDEFQTPEKRSRALLKACEEELGQLKDAKLREDAQLLKGCKVALGYTPAIHQGQCRFFRNYSARHFSQDITVTQAIQATWATPGIFPSVQIGPPLREEEAVSAVNGFNNPITEAIKEAKEIFGPKMKISCLLSLGSGKRRLATSFTGDISNMHWAERSVRDSEVISDDAQRQLGHTGVYFRLSADFTLNADVEHVDKKRLFGSIAAYTGSYLRLAGPESVMDACIKAAARGEGVSLEYLGQTPLNKSKQSAHGLPPLSPFFVPRYEPMKKIIEGIVDDMEDEQKVFILSGLGGSGKTQLAIKFARDQADLFQHILFVDASSAENIEKNLLARLRTIDRSFKGSTKEDAMYALAYPEDELTTRWLIILDNADDPAVDLLDYFPHCNHGVILITTRNNVLGNISPQTHLPLDVMSVDEAVDALLSCVLSSTELRTKAHREHASQIVDQLGYLPIAVTQAGCYIRTQHCFDDYLDRLKENRLSVFQQYSVHKDRLPYKHGVYAAFDTTLRVISPRALKFLSILSFFHYANFPRQLFAVAASYQFEYEPFDLLERSQEFQDSVRLLQGTLCPSGKWNEGDMDQLLEELQKYSLVTLVSVHRFVTLRFHPLLHSWAGDRLSETDRVAYRAAAARLLACGTNDKDGRLWVHLSPHVTEMIPIFTGLHLNEQAALASIIRHDEKNDLLVQIWEHVHQEVAKVYGERHLRTSNAALQLADAYGSQGDSQKMEEMERIIVEIRKAECGPESLEAMDAIINLARTLTSFTAKYEEGETLIKETLQIRRALQGPGHLHIADALFELGKVQVTLGRLEDAEAALKEAVEMRKELLGRSHFRTLEAMQALGECQGIQNKPDAPTIHREVLELRESTYGRNHHITLYSMSWLGRTFHDQGRYTDAERIRREEFDCRVELFGPCNPSTLGASFWLGRAILAQSRFAEAEEVLRKNVEKRRENSSVDKKEYLIALSWLSKSIFEQGRYEEAESLRREETQGWEELYGRIHRETLSALSWVARCVHEQKRYSDAEILRRQELAGWNELYGKVHQDTLVCASWYGQTLFDQGRVEEAKEVWLKCATGWEKLQDEPTRDSLDTLSWLGRLAHEQRRYKDSTAIWRKITEGRKKLFGLTSRETLVAMGWLARSLFDQRKYAESEVVRREEVEGWTKLQGVTRETLDARSWLARTIFEQHCDDGEAEHLWRETVRGWKNLYPQGVHIGICDALFWLGRVLYEQGKFAEAEVVWKENVDIRTALQGDDHPDTENARRCLLDVITARTGRSPELVVPPHVATPLSDDSWYDVGHSSEDLEMAVERTW